MKGKAIITAAFVIGSIFSCLANSKQQDNSFSLVKDKEISFAQLGVNSSISLLGSESAAYLNFGSRIDEIISKASLDFSFIPSPSLVASVSHLKVFLNEELMGVVPVGEGQSGGKITASLPLDSRFISNFNQLRFELVGSTNSICRDPNDSSIWAEISKGGTIRLKIQKSALATDLSLFPVPFFDKRDFSSVTLPFVLPPEQHINELTAAGVLASYFGSLAKWRGIDIPVHIDQLPEQHAVVFATNANKPSFIADLPDVTGPMIQMITHPNNEYVKLLLVLGRNADDLNMAVRGLVLGKNLLTGPSAKINNVTDIKPRQPYDAPNWVNTTRPVSLAELVEGPYQLQLEGRTSSPINVSFNLPPDLFAWQSRGVPIKLGYRYSPTPENSGSRMSFSVNGQFVEAFNLTDEGKSLEESGLRIPLMDDAIISSGSPSHIPAFRIDSNNSMDFEFSFASATNNGCHSAQPSRYYAVMDSDSTLDFSDFSHYIKMPNLRAFASSGFPFSRMADLSETVVVMKASPSVNEIELLMDTMGLIGSKTGYPALKVQMTDDWQSDLKDKDILTIGALLSAAGDVSSQDGAMLLLDETTRQLALPVNNNKLAWVNWLKFEEDDADITRVVDVTAYGPFASVVAMESPFTSSRSLISLVASNEKDLPLISDALNDSGKVSHMFGSVVTIQAGQVASFDVGNTFYAGQLPVYDLILYHFSEHPVVIAICVFVIALALSLILIRLLREISARRLAAEEKE